MQSSQLFISAHQFTWCCAIILAGLISIIGLQPVQAQGHSDWYSAPGAMDNEPQVLQHRLLASHSTVAPGQTIALAWEFTLQPEWHIYWQNAGDSGLPPELRDAAGAVVPLTFPVPGVIALPPITNYGYKNKVTFTAPWQVPATLATGPQSLSFSADFLYCKDVCLPGKATISLPMMVGAAPQANPAFAPQATLPQPITKLPTASRQGHLLALTLPSSLAQAGVTFLPLTEGLIDDSAPQTLRGNTLTLTLDSATIPAPTMLEGIIRDAQGNGFQFAIPLPPASTPQAGADTSGHGGGYGLLSALFFAFVAGLILNLMPCVLPVLSLKVLALVKHHHGPERVRHTLAYTAGILFSFGAFALLVTLLQAGGASVGWGFHLQQPLVVAGLSLLMLALALNFFGLFELGTRLTQLAGRGTRQSLGGSAATGVLAVIVATPCTVPFMGGAMAFALTQPWAATLAVFLSLGLGMAAPFLVLAAWPALLRKLPKPGSWMATFKHALGWPMLATALWLAYVFNSLTSQVPTFALFALGLMLALGLWVFGRLASARWRLFGVMLLGIGVIAGLGGVATLFKPASSLWQPWSAAAVAAGQAAGQPVFVDFTADWCLTCKVTEATVLNTQAAQALFAKHRVLLLRGDWTRQDALITAELSKHGRKGVPLYLLYTPENPNPAVLPQLLTVGLLAARLEAASALAANH